MKIGLITYFIGFNYGGLLQSYVTMEVLRNLGHEVTMIYYHQPWANKRRSWLRLDSWLARNPRKIIDKIKYNFQTPKFKKTFGKMIKNHNPLTEYYGASLDKLMKNPPIFDCYLTGSDQVWSSNCKWQDYAAYFLPFAPKNAKKISYAASLGSGEFLREDLNEIVNCLKQYQHISVREESASKYLHSLGFINTQSVPDPTLLFTADDYSKLLSETKQGPKGLLFYVLRKQSDRFLHLANSIAGQYREVNNIALEDFKIKNAKNILPTVPQFVRNFKDANFIFTNSFHGCVFSIIFKRQFVFIRFDENRKTSNERIEYLLKKLDLTERILDETVSVKHALDMLNKPIIWNSVDDKLLEFRQKGFDFLEMSLGK